MLYLSNPPGIDAQAQRDSLDALGQLNALASERLGDPAIDARKPHTHRCKTSMQICYQQGKSA